MKTYSEISVSRSEDDGGYLLGAYAKGHHDADAFRAAALEQQELDVSNVPVEHEHWRLVPRSDGEPGMHIIDAAPGSRGAFPVTVAWVNP